MNNSSSKEANAATGGGEANINRPTDTQTSSSNFTQKVIPVGGEFGPKDIIYVQVFEPSPRMSRFPVIFLHGDHHNSEVGSPSHTVLIPL
jgi:hypothetical protein